MEKDLGYALESIFFIRFCTDLTELLLIKKLIIFYIHRSKEKVTRWTWFGIFYIYVEKVHFHQICTSFKKVFLMMLGRNY